MTKSPYFSLLAVGVLAACGTSSRSDSDSDAAAGAAAADDGGSGNAGAAGGAQSGGSAGDGGAAGAVGGASGGGAGGASGGLGGSPGVSGGAGGPPVNWTVNEPAECNPMLTSLPCTAEPCATLVSFSLNCRSLPTFDFTAASPADAFFVVEVTGRMGHIELPMTVHDLLVVERHGESISVEQAPFDEGRCKIRSYEDDLFLLCLNSTEQLRVNEVRFARRTRGEWHAETLGAATPQTELLGFEVAPSGSIFAATGDRTTGARSLFVAAPGGDFEVETLEGTTSFETAAMGLDGSTEPVWAAWTHPDTFRLSFAGADGMALELVSQGLESAPLQLAPFAGENNPLIITTVEDVNSAFLPSEAGFTRVALTPANTSSYDCPTDDTDCPGVDRTCHLQWEEYTLPVVATSTSQGTLIAFAHATGATTTHLFDCQANCSCSSLSDYASSSELVLARLQGQSEPAIISRFADFSQPVALAVTGDTVHVVNGGGNSYFTLNVTAL
jgi:hypothetical protein